jgi:glycine betaine/proline transport system substrate-binding protein
MNKKKISIAVTVFTGSALLSAVSWASDCGSVSMAEWNWASGELMANVDKFILEHGYGCEVELVPGATTTTFASMNEKGQPDVAGELWVNAVREPLAIAMEEGRLHSIVNGPITQLGEGWWIPPYTAANHPELETVLDILERPDLFPHPEDPSKGAFVGCPPGWGCQLTNANLFRAFDMEEKGWLLVDPGSAAGLDGSMAKAVERGENWFGYYWSPTSLIGKYSMHLVPFGVEFSGSDNWDGCIVKPEHECDDPQPSAWTHSEVHTVVADEFFRRGGIAIDYLSSRIFPGPIMNSMLVYMSEEQAGGADAAIEFLFRHEDVWTEWVPGDVAENVRAAL